MKKSHLIQNGLSSKLVLYIVFVASVLNIIWYLCMNDVIHIFIFIISALITKCFTNNMILIMGIPLILSITSRYVYIEAFTEESSTTEIDTDTPINKSSKKNPVVDTEKVVPSASDESDTVNKTESSPASTGVESDETETYTNKINYADTLVSNMKSYRDILGNDGFAKMTEDTKELLKQQEELGKSIKQFAPIIDKMTPFLSQASGFLNKLDASHLKEITKNIKNI